MMFNPPIDSLDSQTRSACPPPDDSSSGQSWDIARYENQHAFVWHYGESLLQLLAPQSGERILDLGCGTGHLTHQITASGAIAIGVDASPDMIQQAQQHYPEVQFAVADARDLEAEISSMPYADKFDAVFSNAVLHWIPEPETVIAQVYRMLKPGGRFVAEFGGYGNLAGMVRALHQALRALNAPTPDPLTFWYFPRVGEYAALLEQQGFEVRYAVLFDRPTPLEHGEAGMANWFRMFANPFLKELTQEQQQQVIYAVEQTLKNSHYKAGNWIADYRRIRILAVRV